MHRLRLCAAGLGIGLAVIRASLVSAGSQSPPNTALEFIDTGFENASPLWYEVVDGVVRINLIYDHERSSPNRAAGHKCGGPRRARLRRWP